MVPRAGVLLSVLLSVAWTDYSETVSFGAMKLERKSFFRGHAERSQEKRPPKKFEFVTAMAGPSRGSGMKPHASSQHQELHLRSGTGRGGSSEHHSQIPDSLEGELVMKPHQRVLPWPSENLAKWMVQHMQWDLDSTAEDLPMFPFFRFEHKMPVPIPWPRFNEMITFSTTVKPATPQAWTSACVQVFKGVNLVAAMASDAAEPLTEPYMSIGAEYSLHLKAPDRILNRILEFIQLPLGGTFISRIGNDFIASISKTNYGGKGPEAHAGISSSVNVGQLRFRSSFTYDIHGRFRWKVTL